MKITNYIFFAAIVLPMVLISCRGQQSEQPPVHLNQNMDDQNRFEHQEQNDFFADNRSMRQPVDGTISRGNLREDEALYQGINEDSSFVDDIPVEVSKSFLYRGQDRYEVFCSMCHGLAGDGEGIIMTGGYGYVPAPSLHIDRLRNVNDGYIYSAIANGIRNMPSYAHQIPVEDRWAIVAYVRALQQSQNVPESEVQQQYDVDIASLKEQKENQLAAEQEQQEQQEAAAGEEDISAEAGEKLVQNNGCMACHTTDGTASAGPSWQGLFGHEVELDDGSTVTADEEYIHESIVEPNAKIVDGYQGVMPSYSFLSEADVQSMVEYIKTLSEESSE